MTPDRNQLALDAAYLAAVEWIDKTFPEGQEKHPHWTMIKLACEAYHAALTAQTVTDDVKRYTPCYEYDTGAVMDEWEHGEWVSLEDYRRAATAPKKCDKLVKALEETECMCHRSLGPLCHRCEALAAHKAQGQGDRTLHDALFGEYIEGDF